MSPSKRKCIFCDQPASLSKEHVWPDWLRQYIPRDPTAPNRSLHTTGLLWIDESGKRKSSLNPGKLARPGEMADQRLRLFVKTVIAAG